MDAWSHKLLALPLLPNRSNLQRDLIFRWCHHQVLDAAFECTEMLKIERHWVLQAYRFYGDSHRILWWSIATKSIWSDFERTIETNWITRNVIESSCGGVVGGGSDGGNGWWRKCIYLFCMFYFIIAVFIRRLIFPIF